MTAIVTSGRLTFPDARDLLPELAGYISIPSVSRDSDPQVMRRAAEWLRDQLGFAGARLDETAGNPIVRADWLGVPGAPTILVYGHYDVQPPGSLAEWNSPPFEMTTDGDVIRGRGVTDDKGPVFIVLKLAQAFLAQEGGLPLNVKFLFEGEEEIGSPNLADYLRAHADELAADLVVSADGAMWRPTEPSVSVASKGLVSLSVVVEGAATDLHSGRFGGTVANPVHQLAALLASLHDADGRVAVDGFYEGVHELSDARKAEIEAVAFDEEAYRTDLGVPALFGEAGLSTLERLWERPTLEVNGVEAGGKYTVIPRRAVAHLSCRLVHEQCPDAVFEAIDRHLRERAHPAVTVTVHPDPGGVPAYRVDGDHPSIVCAVAALAEVYPGQEVLRAVIAGTLPATALFEEVLDAKTLFFSFSTADEKLHAPNEFLRIRRIDEGLRAWEVLWRELARALPRGAS
ncbi:M20/M25/M40 family metallo-hydrolase [Micromonospora cremea]|uniref:Acetylornithine deacetylase/Succinyl-diaminopimelate desuccinylase n=1 Tax=Micromonospora cremea TaxID=709881 RepID=A0A1N5TDR4_9ACTN|nr:M20/M25/M40 family metallo-hydrolase [Micromonospora cremea]SIM46570.1 Acetylornithine deacetylase/Succinyl-diaminopimelate desuccinylase [Micromonospora cremea]